MRTVVQLSDLHFGAILEPTIEPLVEFLAALSPQLTIISGDFTQRATREQFVEAKSFLGRLPTPQLVIPGNHDVPLYNVFRRFFSPLDNYDAYISTDHNPTFLDDELAVIALNSARSFTFKGGAISEEQLQLSRDFFAGATNGQVRIVVAHHPFDIPVALSGVEIVDNTQRSVEVFAECSVDVMLTGHLHLVHRADASIRVPGYHATMLGAGTAISTRARGEPNSFFVFRIDSSKSEDDAIHVETHTWNAARNQFEITDARSVRRTTTARAAE